MRVLLLLVVLGWIGGLEGVRPGKVRFVSYLITLFMLAPEMPKRRPSLWAMLLIIGLAHFGTCLPLK